MHNSNSIFFSFFLQTATAWKTSGAPPLPLGEEEFAATAPPRRGCFEALAATESAVEGLLREKDGAGAATKATSAAGVISFALRFLGGAGERAALAGRRRAGEEAGEAGGGATTAETALLPLVTAEVRAAAVAAAAAAFFFSAAAVATTSAALYSLSAAAQAA